MVATQERRLRAKRYHAALGPLLTYVNEQKRLSTLGHIAMDSKDLAKLSEGSKVLDALWSDVSLVDNYVTLNPYNLPRELLETARPWRYAIPGIYTCIDADADFALYQGYGRIFCVSPILRDADSFIHAIPCLVSLVLLPFEDRIVTDGRVMHISDEPRPEAMPSIIEGLKRAAGREVIETPEQLIAFRQRMLPPLPEQPARWPGTAGKTGPSEDDRKRDSSSGSAAAAGPTVGNHSKPGASDDAAWYPRTST